MEKYVQLTQKFRDEFFRSLDHSRIFREIQLDLDKIAKNDLNEEELLAEIFRLLRNACIACPQNQEEIMRQNIPELVVHLISCSTLRSELSDKMILCGLQFCGNFVANNQTTRRHLWKIAFPNMFVHFLSNNPQKKKCEKMCSISTMVLYNCLMSEHALCQFMADEAGSAMIKMLCNQLTVPTNHWAVLCVREHFLKTGILLPMVFSECSPVVQCHVLEISCDVLSEESSANPPWLNTTAVQLTDQFTKRLCDIQKGGSETELIALLLKSLCWVTATTAPWVRSIGDDLIYDVISFLNKLCTDGKISQERHKVSQPVSNTALAEDTSRYDDAVHKSTLFEHGGTNNTHRTSSGQNVTDTPSPNLCFRRDLVRLIGNLCFQNQEMQNRVRGLGGIPLVLGSCNIDDGNPFMQQWAIFAIRNLCENNLQNQAEIAQLEKMGVADSPVLRDMGLTAVQGQDGKIRITKTK